ncbi:MAG TPA: pantoate--beta-alanine ligase [Candidatus Tectomicrobia bacterium]|nr:pantoate--beta-alanine ligase [Candidatus Tectomicrobia bacterium]
MQLLATIAELSQWRATAAPPLGFVPTMGYLHQGHLSLVRRARAENDSVAVSIFVNPRQFGPGEDYQHYPRDLHRDLALLEAEQVEAVFTPGVDEMYPAGASTIVEVAALSHILEGASRPGHFRGVAMIVCELFHLVQPQRAYFGEKDYQQLQVIRRMVYDLRMPVEVIGCPTVREPDGLAMSSRNVYLNPSERQAATALSRALSQANHLFRKGVHEVSRLQAEVQDLLGKEPLIRLDYVAIVHPHTLQPMAELESEAAVICIAVWIGHTRLIDNIRLGS